MRLNVYLQRAGIGSRREAERMVAEARVFVNGTVALPTTPVNDGDKVTWDGKSVAPDLAATPRLFLLHKPIDVLVTNRDHKNRPTVFELPALNKPGLPRLMAVGRLDVNSEGLLVLSTDGPLAQAMMHPDTACAEFTVFACVGDLRMGRLQIWRVVLWWTALSIAVQNLPKNSTRAVVPIVGTGWY